MAHFDTDDTWNKVLRSAADLFNCRDFGMPSLANIAGAARVSEKNVRLLFRSVEDLAGVLIALSHAYVMETARRVAMHHYQGFESLVTITAAVARGMLAEPILQAGTRVLAASSMRSKLPTIGQAFEQWEEIVQRLFERSAVEGDLKFEIGPESTARLFTCTFLGVQGISALKDYENLLEDLFMQWRGWISMIGMPEKKKGLCDRAKELIFEQKGIAVSIEQLMNFSTTTV